MTTSSLTSVPEHEPTYLTCTPVEIDVIGHLISDGASNALIARRIRRSPETVKTHLRRVYERASMQGRTELAVAILRGDIMVLDQQGRRVRF